MFQGVERGAASPARITDASHRPPRSSGDGSWRRPEEEESLRKEYPELAGYVTDSRKRSAGRGTLAPRELRRLLEDCPREPVMKALREAALYGLYDPERVERMILKSARTEFFRLKDDAE